jgi:hypothetical protein
MSAVPQGNSTPDQNVDEVGGLRDVHDVNVAICNNLIYSFSQIPAHLQSRELVEEWFATMVFSKKRSLEECYREVPVEFKSPGFMKIAAKAGIDILGDIDPGQNTFYRDLALTCVRTNYKNLVSLDPEFRDLAAKYLAWSNTHEAYLIAREFPWFINHLDGNDLDRCYRNINFALDCNEIPFKVRREMLIECDVGNFRVIRARGRLGILSEQISLGEWPQEFSDEDFSGPRPRSLDDGIYWLTQSNPNGARETLYMAYMLAQPMDQVVPLMTGQRLQKLLFEMYSTEALQPYLKKSRALRGSFLEDSIGL